MDTEYLKLISFKELTKKDIPPQNWAVENLIPEGLTILAGAPKSGKSILALNIALSLSSGINILDKFPSKPINTLYLPYEDGEARLKKRTLLIEEKLKLQNIEKAITPDIKSISQVNTERLDKLEKVIDDNEFKLVIIDTLGTGVEPIKRRRSSQYMEEYELLSKFQKFATEKKISIVILHHTRKAKADNVFDEISGTRGITGSADANIVLEKNKFYGSLYIQGRDLEDKNYRLEYDKKYFTWIIKGEFDRNELSPEQEQILETYNGDYDKTQKPSEISKALGKEETSIRPTMGKLAELGYLYKPKYGEYKLTRVN